MQISLVIIGLVYSNSSFAIPPGLKVNVTSTWLGNATCSASVSGTASLLSTDGCSGSSNYCFPCANISGVVELGRNIAIAGGGYSWTVFSTATFSNLTGNSYNYSFAIPASTFGAGFAAGEYMIKVKFSYGGITGTYCTSVTNSNQAEGFSTGASNTGVNSYSYTGIYESPSAVSYMLDNKTVSTTSGTYTPSFICQDLILKLNATGTSDPNTLFKIDITKVGTSTVNQTNVWYNYTGANPTYNLKSMLTTTYTAPNLAGQYTVKLTVKNSCNNTGVVYTGYIQVFATPATPVSSFTINNTAVYPTNSPAPLLTYNCSNITLTGLPTNTNGAYEYKVTVDATNAAGTSNGSFTLSSDWTSTIGTDLKNIQMVPYASYYATWLADPSNAGYYRITLSARDLCTSVTSTSSSGLIQVLTPSVTTTMCGEVIPTYGTETCQNTDQNTPYTVCGQQQQIAIRQKVTSITGVITAYRKSLDRWSGSAWVNLYNSPSLTIIPSVNQYISPATTTIMGALVDNVLYRSTIKIINPCTTATDTQKVVQYFKVNTACKTDGATGIEDQDFEKGVSIYPVPASNELIVKFLTDTRYSKASLIDLSGRVVLTTNLESLTEISLNVSTLARGIYVLELNGVSNLKRKIVIE